jgi:DNA-binding PadR family transcriptional regulator
VTCLAATEVIPGGGQAGTARQGITKMRTHWSDEEIACINALAAQFVRGALVRSDEMMASIPPGKVVPILTTMEENGLIDEVTHTTQSRFSHFKITSKAVQCAREIAKEHMEMQILEQQKRLAEEQRQREIAFQEERRKEDRENRRQDLQWLARQAELAEKRWNKEHSLQQRGFLFVGLGLGITGILVLAAAQIIAALIARN